jgi:hypothetical protein
MRFCARCDSCRWVCEAHPERPWLGPPIVNEPNQVEHPPGQ